MTRSTALLAAATATLALLTGCGDDPPEASSTPTAEDIGTTVREAESLLTSIEAELATDDAT